MFTFLGIYFRLWLTDAFKGLYILPSIGDSDHCFHRGDLVLLSFPVFGKFQGNQFGSQGLRSNKKNKRRLTLSINLTQHITSYIRDVSAIQRPHLAKSAIWASFVVACGISRHFSLAATVSVKNVYVSIFIYLVYKSNHHLQNYCLWGYKTLYTNRAALKTHLSI